VCITVSEGYSLLIMLDWPVNKKHFHINYFVLRIETKERICVCKYVVFTARPLSQLKPLSGRKIRNVVSTAEKRDMFVCVSSKIL